MAFRSNASDEHSENTAENEGKHDTYKALMADLLFHN
jgi:hypothetical protein